jgi:hypothetical protein
MKHLQIYENFEQPFNPNYNPKEYKILNPGQIQHYRQVFRLRPAREVDYVFKVLDSIEKKGGKYCLEVWVKGEKTLYEGYSQASVLLDAIRSMTEDHVMESFARHA